MQVIDELRLSEQKIRMLMNQRRGQDEGYGRLKEKIKEEIVEMIDFNVRYYPEKWKDQLKEKLNLVIQDRECLEFMIEQLQMKTDSLY